LHQIRPYRIREDAENSIIELRVTFSSKLLKENDYPKFIDALIEDG